jgi:hypothetical protein
MRASSKISGLRSPQSGTQTEWENRSNFRVEVVGSNPADPNIFYDSYTHLQSLCYLYVLTGFPRIPLSSLIMPRPGFIKGIRLEAFSLAPPSNTVLSLRRMSLSRSAYCTSFVADAKCTPAVIPIVDSPIQPIMQGILAASATAAIFLAFRIPPLFMNLMLIRSAAFFLITYIASSGE